MSVWLGEEIQKVLRVELADDKKLQCQRADCGILACYELGHAIIPEGSLVCTSARFGQAPLL
jgi:hypothetical protein